jgi:hypothetical protein
VSGVLGYAAWPFPRRERVVLVNILPILMWWWPFARYSSWAGFGSFGNARFLSLGWSFPSDPPRASSIVMGLRGVLPHEGRHGHVSWWPVPV